MKIEVNIDKKILLIVIGMLLIGAGVYASVNTSLPYHDASQTRLSNGDSVQDFANNINVLVPGNITLAMAGNTVGVTSTTYTKVKEIQVAQSGIVNVSFEMSTSGAVYGRIYKNGVAVGTERNSGSSSFRTYYENINVTAGDKIQLYSKQGSSYGFSEVRNLKIGVANKLPIAAVIYEAEGSKW